MLMMMRRLLRGVAFAIAVAGAIDPGITSARAVRPTIALLDTTDVEDSSTTRHAADIVATALARGYLVERAPTPDATATIVVGDRLPSTATLSAGPLFVVAPSVVGPRVRLTRVEAPRTAPLDTTIPISVTAHVEQARGRQLELVLTSRGAAFDRIVADVASDDLSVTRTMTFVGADVDLARVTVTARVLGSDAMARADALVEIGTRPWSVLFFDRRPSWASTFVRRALERDRRFVVASRIRTSTNVSTDTGPAPATLDATSSLDAHDVIVVGAPDALSTTEVAALEAFARRRGGSVIALLDQPGAGVLASLVGIDRWQPMGAAQPVSITSTVEGLPPLRATEFATPEHLPATAEVIADVTIAGVARAVVVAQPVGAGQIIVSGALDAWRYRGVPESSPFDRFWQFVGARGAARAPRPIDVDMGHTLLMPGEVTSVRVRLRDLTLAPVRSGASTARVSARVDAPGDAEAVRMWPTRGPGEFTGELRAPSVPGTYRLVVTRDGNDAALRFVVSADARRAEADARDALHALAATHGGRVVAERDLSALTRALDDTLHPEHRRQPWWPMRSAWWIVAFGGVLGGEWWMRRRSNLR